MLTIVVDDQLVIPPFQQIMEQIRAMIERGDLHAGASLPAVRQLAGDLGVAPNTVARAYLELQGGGWLQALGRRGTIVAARTPNSDPIRRRRMLNESIEEFVSMLRHRGFTRIEIGRALAPFAE